MDVLLSGRIHIYTSIDNLLHPQLPQVVIPCYGKTWVVVFPNVNTQRF
jgi:hypothetical protein